MPCDTGTDILVLKKEMEGKPIDLSLLTDGWNMKTGRWSPSAQALKKRAKEARQWLKTRPEKDIVVVTHGGFLHYFTEDWSGYKPTLGENSHHHFGRRNTDRSIRYRLGKRGIS